MNVTWFWNNCSRHAQRLSLLAAGMLPEAERAILQNHLHQCSGCQARLKQAQDVAAHLRTAGETIPRLEPPLSLQRRWRNAVLREANASHAPSPLHTEQALDRLAGWLTGGRLAWGAVCACWLLVAFFRASAPDASRPAVVAASVSWQEIRMALRKIERRPSQLPPEQECALPDQPPRQTFPPRTEREKAVENA